MSELAQKMAAVQAQPVQRGATVADLIERQRDQIARALPNSMSPERFGRLILTEVRKVPRLAECTPSSLLGAMMTAAQLGLEPGPLGHAYLIPRRSHGRWEVGFFLGWRGMVELAMRSGRLDGIRAHVVYAEDEFEYSYGTGAHEYLRHVPTLGDRGERLGVYAVARLRDGGSQFVVLSMSEVERRRARGGKDGSNESPAWTQDYDAMAAKTALRALAPWLPQTPEFAAAQRLDDAVRTDFTARLDDLEPDEAEDEPVQVAAQVVDAVDGPTEEARRDEVMRAATSTAKGKKAVADWRKANDVGLSEHSMWAPELWEAFEVWVNAPAETEGSEPA